MDKRRIEELAEDPGSSPASITTATDGANGVFTSRCMTYAMEKDEYDDPQSQDIDNKAFWDKLHGIFKVTLEMVREKAEEMGIDLDAADLDEIARQNKQVHELAKEQPCSQAAIRYSEMVDDWLHSNKSLLEEKSSELQAIALAGIPGTNPGNEAVSIRDCLEVVHWYQHQIHVKLCRAASGMIRGDLDDLDNAPQDADGSAKVAIIGIERSMAAWTGLLHLFPDQEQRLFDLLATLKRLLRQVEATYPNARAFVRPGFDMEE